MFKVRFFPIIWKSVFIALAFSCFSGMADRALGQLIAYEGFNFAPGSNLYNLGGGEGIGFSGNWDPRGNAPPQYQIGYSTLSDSTGTLATSGGCCSALTASPAWTCATRNLTNSLGTSGTTAYFSCLIRPEGQLGVGDAGGYFGMYLYSAYQSNYLFFGKGAGAYSVEVVGGIGPHYSTVFPALERTDLLVLRVDFKAGVDKVSLYVNPTPGQPEPATPDATKTDFDLGTVTAPGIFSSGTFSVDEIRVGRGFADVVPRSVPEPSALALLLAASISALLWRRRRQLPNNPS
jgi:hypothetical protein